LFAKTAAAASDADVKATTAAEQALLAQKKAAEAEQKAIQLAQELAEKNKRLEELERREKERETREITERIASDEKIKELEVRQKKAESALVQAKAKMEKVDVLDDLLTEIGGAGDQKQINASAVDKIDMGFARLQARDEEGRRIVIAEVTVLRETVSELQSTVEMLKEQVRQQKKSTPFWQRDARAAAGQEKQIAPAKAAVFLG
jgi:23S rRNA pseudoU1915 N3-methylase RlmH